MHKNVTRLTTQEYRGFQIDHSPTGFVVGSIILIESHSLTEVRLRIDEWFNHAELSEERRRTQKRSELDRRCG